jgi:hypothetical protein
MFAITTRVLHIVLTPSLRCCKAFLGENSGDRDRNPFCLWRPSPRCFAASRGTLLTTLLAPGEPPNVRLVLQNTGNHREMPSAGTIAADVSMTLLRRRDLLTRQPFGNRLHG